MRNPSTVELLLLILSFFLSSAAGIALAWGFNVLNDERLLLFTGVAHVFVFAGMLWFMRLGKLRMLGYIALCLMFPLWGFPLGGWGLVAISILICSVVWGSVLWFLLEDPMPFLVMLVIGLVQPISLVIIGMSNDQTVPGWYFPSMIAYWHITSAACVLLCGLRYRKMLSGLSIEHCSDCDYPLDGLDSIDACPECGKPRALPMFQSKKTASKVNADVPGSPDIELGGFSPDR